MRIGTVGTGFITNYILDNIEKTDGISCHAVYSRNEDSARRLAKKYHIEKTYTDYERMLSDDSLDFIYIASPNSLHYSQTKSALEHGKNVICEKPFTVTAAEAVELIRLAKENHLFLFEAITTLHQPGFHWVRKNISLLGSIKMISLTFCQYSSRYDSLISGKLPNVFNPEFAGGALMDINLYNIHFLVGLFGKPDRIEYFAGTHENGIDTHGILILQFGDIICQCSGSKNTTCENNVQIMGEKGYIHVSPGSSNCQNSRLILRDSECSFCQKETPWYYEIQELTRIVQSNDYERCYQLLENTEIVVDILEKARKSAHLGF